MSTTVEYWTSRYRAQGDTYVARGGDPESYDAQLRAIEPWLKDAMPKGGRVLDFGCGPGRFRPAIEAVAAEYVGVDIIPGLGTQEPGERLPGGFDGAAAIFVLQHIVDEGEYLKAVDDLLGSLKPGGVLFVVDHEPDADVEWEEHMLPRGRFPVLGHVAVGNMQGLILEDLPGNEVSLFYKKSSGLPAAEAKIGGEGAPSRPFESVPPVIDIDAGVLRDGWYGIESEGDVVRFPNGGPVYRIVGWRDRLAWAVCEMEHGAAG